MLRSNLLDYFKIFIEAFKKLSFKVCHNEGLGNETRNAWNDRWKRGTRRAFRR